MSSTLRAEPEYTLAAYSRKMKDNHPEFAGPNALPMIVYTAINLRRFLTPPTPLSSYMILNVVLPAFIPSSSDPHAIFCARGRAAQSQMRKYYKSPLFFTRSQIMSAEHGLRGKAFAKMCYYVLLPVSHCPFCNPRRYCVV
ncbi:hypothetical protein B0H10DRAFT_2218488 [Mycena sp. CBHHK59/15]|nr:hypothetical protein B0H10DRAFT_2218488 [Mycena sp. CBHHK59/15]